RALDAGRPCARRRIPFGRAERDGTAGAARRNHRLRARARRRLRHRRGPPPPPQQNSPPRDRPPSPPKNSRAPPEAPPTHRNPPRLADKVTYHHGNALAMPFADASFDLVWSQNAAMNIADRDRLYGEMHRVLVPAGRLAFQDVAAGPGGDPHFPTPWANDKRHTFLFISPPPRGA